MFKIGDIVYNNITEKQGVITSISKCGCYYRTDGASGGYEKTAYKLIDTPSGKVIISNGILVLETSTSLITLPLNSLKIKNKVIEGVKITDEQYEYIKEELLRDGDTF